MRIQEPNPSLSAIDVEIICLIAEILTQESDDFGYNGNIIGNMSLVSEQNARELLRLLVALLERKDFREKMAFVDGVGFSHDESNIWKKMFFKKSGRRAVQSTQKWEIFMDRLWRSALKSPYMRTADYMSFDQFLKMEGRLFDKIGIDGRVKVILIKTISLLEVEIERRRKNNLRSVNIITKSVMPLVKLLQDRRIVSGGLTVDSDQLAGLATLVSNCGILFTTRDWGIAGTISTMAGSLAMLPRK